MRLLILQFELLGITGHSIMTNTAPLLVDCHNIIKWLQERKKIPKDWYSYEKAASQKIKLLLRDLQQYAGSNVEGLVPYIKENTENFNFCDVAQVVEMLLKTEWAQQKSLLFGYSDKRVKQWVKLRSFMESKQVSVINIAKFIDRGLSFDLPSLNKNVQLLDSQMANLKRKIDFNNNAIYQQQKEDQSQRIKLGFEEGNLTVEDQIPKLIKAVPSLFNEVEKRATRLEGCIDFYQSCNKESMHVLVTLQMLMKNGNGRVVSDAEGETLLDNNVAPNETKYDEFQKWRPTTNEWGIQVCNAMSSDSKPNIAETLLQKRSTRLKLLQDLNELLYFLKGLKYQSSITSNMAAVETSSAISLTDHEVQGYAAEVEQIIGLLNGAIATRVELKNNSNAYQILLRKFKNYQKNVGEIRRQNQQYETQIEQMKIKREEVVKELLKLRARLVRCKNECEKYLSELIKREIRITGEVNKLE